MNRSPVRRHLLLWKRIRVPETRCTEALVGGRWRRYAGDVRVGDLGGSGDTDFLVYRSRDAVRPTSLRSGKSTAMLATR